MSNLSSGIFLIAVFFAGLVLGYRGMSLRDIGEMTEHYLKEGDKVLNRTLKEYDEIRIKQKEKVFKHTTGEK